MKLCVDCKHFSGLNFCKHPSNGISLVYGEPKPEFASVKRSNKQDCGKEGRLYEEREPEIKVKPQTWWEMFWSRKK